MTEAIENLFIYVAIYVCLLPVLVFIWKFRTSSTSDVLKIVAIYCAFEFLINYISLWVPVRVIRILYSVFTAVEYGLFALLFYLLIENARVKRGIKVLSVGFYVFWTIYRIFGKLGVLDSIPIGVETILVLIIAFWYLFEQMDKVADGFIYQRFSFWLASAIMIYLAGSFFCYISANRVVASTRNVFWMFTNIFTTIKCIFFVIAMIIHDDQLKNAKKATFKKLSF